jgi:hypothetical protein
MALYGAVALAQPPPPPPPPLGPAQDSVFFVAGGAGVLPFGGPVDIIAGEGSVMGEVVAGKPYSADSVTESTQILADGNRITRLNRARIYRDSAGRTRREHTLDGLGVLQTAGEPVTMVMINDPVKDVSYFLDPRAQTARELTPFKLETLPALPVPPPGEPAPLGAPPGVALGTFTRSGVAGGPVAIAGSVTQTIEAAQFDGELPPPGALPMLPAGPIGFSAVTRFDGAAGAQVTDALGEQVLEGVLARGTRQTQTIAAGAIGNEQPIEIVQEQWFSPDLQAIVLRRSFDPRFGETVYRLINVDRSEPSPELFAVPQNYELQSDQGPQTGARRAGPSGPLTVAPPGAGPPRLGRRVFLVQPDSAATGAAGE